MGNSALKRHFATAEKTGVLNISKNKLHDFPPQIKSLQGVLRTLDISCNRFISLPPEIGGFHLLKTLNLDHNFLTELPEELEGLTKLENLSAVDNKLKTLPRALGKLLNLKQVNFSSNSIKEFPLALCGLKHLDAIDLSENKITEIPQGVSMLHVTELNLNQNQISLVSEDIADCQRLKTLRLEENCLSLETIPRKLLTDSKVSMLSVEGNLFEMKKFMNLEGYEKYMDRYTAVKKKLF